VDFFFAREVRTADGCCCCASVAEMSKLYIIKKTPLKQTVSADVQIYQYSCFAFYMVGANNVTQFSSRKFNHFTTERL
jgi:hypothetical protein